jgi:hypothetical protein
MPNWPKHPYSAMRASYPVPTASAGGDPNCNCGVVFKMTPQANGKWKYTVLHRFQGTDGEGPGYNLIFDKNYKHLYGTTVAGGPGRCGVVYEITP